MGQSVRGIAQLALLEVIESSVNAKVMLHIQKESGRVDQSKLINITDIFDVFSGTSAGALNVGAILIPDNPEGANLPEVKVKPPVYYRRTPIQASRNSICRIFFLYL